MPSDFKHLIPCLFLPLFYHLTLQRQQRSPLVLLLSLHPCNARQLSLPSVSPQKCLRLNPDVPVWASKQRILCTLNHSLKDVLNYGLFQPAFNGRAGKFLDEERLLREYPLNPDTPVPYLEVAVFFNIYL